MKWFEEFQKVMEVNAIAIDGKFVRKSRDQGQSMLHLVSAYAVNCQTVLGQKKVASKKNEICGIHELVEDLKIEGTLITIDAMGCQYEIGQRIVEKGGDYILALKGNQGKLHRQGRSMKT